MNSLYIGISNILADMKITRNLKGHAYLCDAIMIAVNDFNAVYNLSKNVYDVLAKKYDTSSGAVYSDVCYAIRTSWKTIDDDKMKKYYIKGMGACNEAPSNGRFIIEMSNAILVRMNKEKS